jgi:hypothetical protein
MMTIVGGPPASLVLSLTATSWERKARTYFAADFAVACVIFLRRVVEARPDACDARLLLS